MSQQNVQETRLDAQQRVLLLPQRAVAGEGKSLHCHPEGQLYIAGRGVIVIEAGESRSVLPAGRMGWIPPNVMHGATMHGGKNSPGIVGYTLFLQADLCAKLPHQPTLLTATPLCHLLIERMSLWPAGTPVTQSDNHIFQVFMDEINQLRGDRFQLPVPKQGRLLHMTTALLEDPASEVNLDGWASRLGMSRRSITRHFRAETGMSLVEWRQTARLQRALEMLNAGDSVTEVALSLGYHSVSSFISLFKRTFGTTPAKFAK